MEESLLELLVAWGVDPQTAMTVSQQVRRETARIATIVAMRELEGCYSPNDRTQIEKEAIACVEAQLDKAILAYGLAEKLTPSTIKQVNKKAHSLGMLQVGAAEFWDDF